MIKSKIRLPNHSDFWLTSGSFQSESLCLLFVPMQGAESSSRYLCPSGQTFRRFRNCSPVVQPMLLGNGRWQHVTLRWLQLCFRVLVKVQFACLCLHFHRFLPHLRWRFAVFFFLWFSSVFHKLLFVFVVKAVNMLYRWRSRHNSTFLCTSLATCGMRSVVPNLFYYIPPFAHFGTSHSSPTTQTFFHSSPITRVYENLINGYILSRLPFTCHGELIFELGRLYGLQIKNGLYWRQ